MLSKIVGKVKHFFKSLVSSAKKTKGWLSMKGKGGYSFLKRRISSSQRTLASMAVIAIFMAVLVFVRIEQRKDGLIETVDHLNSLNDSEKLIIWSNKESLCALFNGTCYFGEAIPEYAEFDRFVFFTNQNKNAIINESPFQNLKDLKSADINVKKLGKYVTKAKIISIHDIPKEMLPTQAEFTFAVIGDSQRWGQLHHGENERFYSILEKIREANPDFLLAMGDLTPDYDCDFSSDCKPYFENWRDEVDKYVSVVYPAFGNHDEYNKARDFWREVFSLPDNGPEKVGGTAFSFEYKNSNFIFLDSERSYQQQEGTEQMEWLKNSLEKNLKRNTFVISHAPNFPRPVPKQTSQWKTLFENNVFAQFSGDTHVFCQRTVYPSNLGLERKNIIRHFIIGNSASMVHPLPPECENSYRGLHYAIVKIKGAEMTVSVFKYTGELISESKILNENYFSSN